MVLFNYKKDIHLTQNIFADKNAAAILKTLLTKVRAFLQKANAQYNNNSFK